MKQIITAFCFICVALTTTAAESPVIEKILQGSKLQEFDRIVEFIQKNWNNRAIHEKIDGFTLVQRATDFRKWLTTGSMSDQKFYREIEKFILKLHDGHMILTFEPHILRLPSMDRYWLTSGMGIEKVKEGYAIVQCESPCKGIVVPALIKTVDGRAIENWVRERAELQLGSTRHGREHHVLREFLKLSGPVYLGKPEKITYLSQNKPVEYALKWVPAEQSNECMTSQVVGETVVLKIRSFVCPGGSKKDVNGFEKLLIKELSKNKAKSLILDFRNNPGGWDEYIQLIYAVLIKERAPWQSLAHMKEGESGRKWHPDILPYKNADLNYLKEIPVKVLVNSGCGSSCDVLAGILKDSGRAKLFGEITHGYCGDGTFLEVLGKYKLRVPNAICYGLHDDTVEGRGVAPNVEFIPSLEAFKKNRDPLMAFVI